MKPWMIFAAIALVAAGVGVWMVSRFNTASRATAEIERRDEAAKLADAGVSVVERTEDLGPALQAVEEYASGLEDEIVRLKKLTGAKPVQVVRANTGRLKAGGTPRPVLPADAPAGAGPTPVASHNTGVGTGDMCLLSPGDTGEIRLGEATLTTSKGNTIFAGVAETWRLTPPPATKLFSGPLSFAATEKAPEPQASEGWAFGPGGGFTSRGWIAGASVATPQARLPLLGWRIHLSVMGAGGPGGGVGFLSGMVRP